MTEPPQSSDASSVSCSDRPDSSTVSKEGNPTRSTITELLLLWDEERRQGQAPAAEELCRDSIELVDELQRRIDALTIAYDLIDSGATHSWRMPSEDARAAGTELKGKVAAETTDYRPTRRANAGTPTVPGYQILGQLGRGGMGVVYEALHLKLNRRVALKMIRDGLLAGPDELQRFRKEAETVASIQHPNIIQIFEVGEHAGLPYCSLELASGGSLAKRLQGKPLPARQGAEMVATLALAVHAAHERGIVHRDLKPANILMSGEWRVASGESTPATHDSPLATPKIADFGLAKQLNADLGQTATGAIMGTPSYMAPEQAAGRTREVGPLADVYALGAIFYELLTGRPPFVAETSAETIRQVVAEEPVPPRRLQPKIPRDLETICLKCLQKKP